MFAKKYLLPLLLFAASCGSPNQEQQVKVFLTKWSKALTAKDQSVRTFYDARFVFPNVVFEAAEGVRYSFDVEHLEITGLEENGHMNVTVPFQVAGPDGSNAEHGSLLLTIIKTGHGFLIHDMS